MTGLEKQSKLDSVTQDFEYLERLEKYKEQLEQFGLKIEIATKNNDKKMYFENKSKSLFLKAYLENDLKNSSLNFLDLYMLEQSRELNTNLAILPKLVDFAKSVDADFLLKTKQVMGEEKVFLIEFNYKLKELKKLLKIGGNVVKFNQQLLELCKNEKLKIKSYNSLYDNLNELLISLEKFGNKTLDKKNYDGLLSEIEVMILFINSVVNSYDYLQKNI